VPQPPAGWSADVSAALHVPGGITLQVGFCGCMRASLQGLPLSVCFFLLLFDNILVGVYWAACSTLGLSPHRPASETPQPHCVAFMPGPQAEPGADLRVSLRSCCVCVYVHPCTTNCIGCIVCFRC
jgi:hypothetical protein